MDPEQLQEKWAEYDRKLDANLHVNRQLLSEMHLNRTRSALQRLIVGLTLEAVIELVVVVALGSFLYAHFATMRFALPAVILDVLAITLLAALIRQITLALSIDYARPIATIQKQLETLRIARIHYVQGIFLVATLAWTPLLIVALKGFFGWDAYHLFGAAFLIANLLVGLTVIPLAIWLSKRFGDQMGRSSIIQHFMRDLAGVNLNAASGFLSTISQFENET